MKIYRCVVGGLLVLFIAIAIGYIVSCYYEQGSTKDGTLVERGVEQYGADYDLY